MYSELITRVDNLFLSITENMKCRKKLLELEEHIGRLSIDALTNFNVRVVFDYERFEIDNNVKNKNHDYIVYFIDVDNLHTINRLKGYDAGDTLLRTVANYIHHICKSVDDVVYKYRLGGDEFLIIGDLKNKEELDHIYLTPNTTIASMPYTHDSDETLSTIMKKLDKEVIKKKSKNRNMNKFQLYYHQLKQKIHKTMIRFGLIKKD